MKWPSVVGPVRSIDDYYTTLGLARLASFDSGGLSSLGWVLLSSSVPPPTLVDPHFAAKSLSPLSRLLWSVDPGATSYAHPPSLWPKYPSRLFLLIQSPRRGCVSLLGKCDTAYTVLVILAVERCDAVAPPLCFSSRFCLWRFPSWITSREAAVAGSRYDDPAVPLRRTSEQGQILPRGPDEAVGTGKQAKYQVPGWIKVHGYSLSWHTPLRVKSSRERKLDQPAWTRGPTVCGTHPLTLLFPSLPGW